MRHFSLHLFTKLLAAGTLVLLAAGGLVTSTGSGLSVPDWPLSYGMLFPPMVGGVRFEHTHRVIAGLIGLLTLAMLVWILRSEKNPAIRRLGIFSFAAVLIQAILGGLTVIYLLPPAISIVHACLGQTFFCLIVTLTVLTSAEWEKGLCSESESASRARNLLVLTTAFIYLQLVLGAVVRHTKGEGLNYHFLLAFIIVVHVFLVFFRILKESEARERFLSHALIILFLTLTQIMLGFGAFVYKLILEKAIQPRPYEVFFATAHQVTGALLLGTCLALTLRVFHGLKPLPENLIKVEMTKS